MSRRSPRNRTNGRVRYKKPWAKWFVNLLVLLGLTAGVLLAMAYVPPYWHSWKAQSAVKDIASQSYSRRSQDDDWYEVLADVKSRLRTKLTKILGEDIASESLRITVTKKEKSSWIRIRVKWDELAKIPLINEARVLHFTIEARAGTR